MNFVLDRTSAVTCGEKVRTSDVLSIRGARSSEFGGPTSAYIGQLSGTMRRKRQRVRALLPLRMLPDAAVAGLLQVVLSPWAHSKTVGALSIEPGEEEPWVAKNRRRGYLIDKKHTNGLTASEEEELEELQADIYHHVRSAAPLSFEVLEELEERARQLGILVPQGPAG